jgi:hypothetical protein
MRIYFIASSRLVKVDPKLYEKIYINLARDNKMVSEKVLKWVRQGIKDIEKAPKTKKVENYKDSVNSIKKADIVIMEVTGHSMSMGYLLSKALEISKPVVAIHQKSYVPNFISGITDPKLMVLGYDKDNIFEVLEGALKKAKSLIDVRFNFFVSPKILNYLDWVAQKRMVPRSVFLRDLIEKEIKKDREFKG